MNFLDRLKREVLVMDGAMGTLLLDSGVKPGAALEELNLTDPDGIFAVHKAYVDAGADIIETNCFGGNRIKLGEAGLGERVKEINEAGVKLARKAAGDKVFVAGNIGPTGKLLFPMGELSFDEAYESYAEQAKIFEDAGADLISVETMTDVQELKAAIMAVKENTKLPVMAHMTFEDNGITVTGTPPEVFVLIAESAGADVIGANCSNGPKILLPVIEKIAKRSTVPVSVLPNAGFPELIDGKAVYKMTPEEFGAYGEKFLKMGVNIIGGCCGTRAEHIKEIRRRVTGNQLPVNRKIYPLGGFASRTRIVNGDKKLLLIGERINPTGKKYLKEEIKSGKMSIIKTEASAQARAGADLIDVNVGVADMDEVSSMRAAVAAVSSAMQAPVSIDSPKLQVLEAGLKSFVGKPLVNSTTGKEDSLKAVLPLVKRFGASVIGLCLDDSGIPQTAEGRLAVAKEIVKRAGDLGIAKDDIYIDALVMTAGIGVDASLETLKAVKLIKEKLKVKTVLGISNVSHGMPQRSRLNSVYLKLAIAHGVDAVIIDPTDKAVMKVVRGQGSGARGSIKKLIEQFKTECEKWKQKKGKQKTEEQTTEKKLTKIDLAEVRKSVIVGDQDKVAMLVNELIKRGQKAQNIIDRALVPAMEIVGKRFSSGKYFLPQVIASAEAMRAGFETARIHIKGKQARSAGTVVLATVRGDIHDIGKNIVKMMLENNGFRVVDLGKDVPPEKIIETAKSERADAVALSALLTTTMPEMEVVKGKLHAQGIDIPVIIGGAVVTKDYACRIGAEYGADAVSSVAIAKKIIGKLRRSKAGRGEKR